MSQRGISDDVRDDVMNVSEGKIADASGFNPAVSLYLLYCEIMGFIEKLEYRCATTNNPLCNGITVVKIPLLNSVSVITTFVIRNHDKQTTKQIHHTFCLQPACDGRSPPHRYHNSTSIVPFTK